jgi:hypothetical protein
MKIAKENSRSIESIISDSNVVYLGKLNHQIDEDLDIDFQNLAKNSNEKLNKCYYLFTHTKLPMALIIVSNLEVPYRILLQNFFI